MAEVPEKSICICTTFTSADSAYSLNRVVQDQIKMFALHDYKVKVIVAEGFKPIEAYILPNVTIETIPSVPCHNEIKKDETFDTDVEKLTFRLKEILKDVSVVITHDIIYQPAALKHNFASRKVAQEFPNIRWLHWIHSATSPYTLSNLMGIFDTSYTDLVKQEFPNSFYVFFNDYSKPRIANNFGVDIEKVKTVHHPIDVCGYYGFDDKVTELVNKKDMLSADAIGIYPCRLDRGKQVEMLIKTMAMLKTFDMSVRIVVVDFHSTGGDKVTYRVELKAMAIDWGLNPQELTFTSEAYQEWNYEVPQKIVRDFMLLANVLVMPSVSESYSLVTQEAGLRGMVVVLNQDFPPFRDIFGSHAIFRKYSSGIDVLSGMDGWTKTEYGPNAASKEERKTHEKRYHQETAGMIAYKLRNYDDLALSIFIRKNRNLKAVFKRELEPLLYG